LDRQKRFNGCIARKERGKRHGDTISIGNVGEGVQFGGLPLLWGGAVSRNEKQRKQSASVKNPKRFVKKGQEWVPAKEKRRSLSCQENQKKVRRESSVITLKKER